MDNKVRLVIKYFNFVFAMLAFFAPILDGQGIIVKIIYFDTIFIAHSRSLSGSGEGVQGGIEW
jgi:hypothetical protein